MPKSGGHIQYNKFRNVLQPGNLSINTLKTETYFGMFPIYFYSEPFPVEIIMYDEKPITSYVTIEETISYMLESRGFGADTVCLHNQTILQ